MLNSGKMKRRQFLQNAAVGIGSMLVLPNVSMLASSEQARQVVVPLGGAMPQIRHGLLNLPQLGLDNQMESSLEMPFEWLGEIRRNLFFKNGFQASDSDEDIEIISVMYHNKDSEQTEAVQIQLSQNEARILLGEQFYTCSTEGKFHEISNNANGNLSLYFSQIDGGESDRQTFKKDSELFVHILEGAVEINEIELFADYGLAINHHEELKFEALESSKMLIFENTKAN